MGQERRKELKQVARGAAAEDVRLHKFLAQCGVASRRAAEVLIAEGRVAVNGKTIRQMGVSINPRKDRVTVNGHEVGRVELGVMLLHKPKNVVSTLSDPENRPSLRRYLTKQTSSYFPVGRLDFESTGLVIMTNDGELAQHLLHPKYEADRVYEVIVEGDLPVGKAVALSRGISLEDGRASADAEILQKLPDRTKVRVTIHEGRNRIVRRIFAAIGFPVKELKRVSHGPFRLGHLKPSECRRLSMGEYRRLRRMAMSS